MKAETKERWLAIAELIDSLRVFPRVMMATYFLFLYWVTGFFALMYFDLPAAERTPAVTAFVTAVLTAAWAGLVPMTLRYLDSGRDWDAAKRPAVTVNQNAA